MTVSGSIKGGGRATLRVRVLRWSRSLHALMALGILLLVVISSATGILLGWKKNSATLQPPTQRGEATTLGQWRPLEQLATVAIDALEERVGAERSAELSVDRLDVRPGRGIVKVLFSADWEVQVDGATGEVLSVARRHSDWIERIHDGSIISDGFKLVAMNVLGLGLLALTTTGFWMWYGPKRLRRKRLLETGHGEGRRG